MEDESEEGQVVVLRVMEEDEEVVGVVEEGEEGNSYICSIITTWPLYHQ